MASLNAATEFVFESTGVAPGFYALADGLAPGWDLSLLSYSGLLTSDATFMLGADGRQLFLNIPDGGLYFGPLLQNSNPVNIPIAADFLVEGPVQTGMPTESNIINSLIFKAGSFLKIFNTLSVTSGNLTVESGGANVIGNTMVVPGTLTKWGQGLLDLMLNVFVNGPANITEGSLMVNGNFTTTGGLTVLQNAFLGGSGTINGSVFNNGLVAPGNSPGVLTINGDYTQSNLGAFQLEIASPDVFDQLVVNGTAYLDGLLQVVSLGSNVLEFGQQISFLHAGAIQGAFDRIELPNPEWYRARFLAEGGEGSLLIAPASYTLVAQTDNQRNVAAALDHYIGAQGNDRAAVSLALDLQTADEYPTAFDAISPAFYESLANITIEQTNAQNQMLAQRLSAVRLGARGFQTSGFEAPMLQESAGKSVMDAKEGKDILSPGADPSWGVWVQGNGIFAKVTNVSQVPNYRFQSGGFLSGIDYQWNEGFTTGVYAGYQGINARYDGGGRNQINSALFGGYASWRKGGFYSDAIASGGYSSYNSRRPIEFSTIDRTATSKSDGGLFNAYLDFGYDWQWGNFTFGPVLAGQYTYVGIAPFTERGADSLNLRVDQQNANSLRTSLGGRIAYAWKLNDSVAIVPEIRMLWQHEFLNNPRNIGATLDGGAGPGVGYETSAPGRDSVFAGAGLSAQLGERWNAYFYYNADFGRQDYVGQMISGGLGWKF